MNKSLHLLYHELRPGSSAYQYVVSCSAFENHCKLYAQLHAEAGDHFRPEITFDDGHVSDLRYALPTLLSHGLRARFFITAGWTSARSAYMSWAELRELQHAGQLLGAHGMTHKLLTRCTSEELIEELGGARKRLEDGLGVGIQTMSLPGGRANRRIFAACREAGYVQVFTSEPFAVNAESMPGVIGRLNLTGAATVETIKGLLTPVSGRLGRAQRVHQIKSAAQATLGDKMYARLWAALNRQESPGPADEVPVQ